MNRSQVAVGLLLFALLVSGTVAVADTTFSITLPSSITVPAGTTGEVSMTINNLGPTSLYTPGWGGYFPQGMPQYWMNDNYGLSSITFNPGVTTVTWFTLSPPANTVPGQYTDLDLAFGLRNDYGTSPQGWPYYTLSFYVGNADSQLVLGDPVTTWGTIPGGPAVPEPGTLVLLGSGLLGVGGAIRRKLRS